MFSEKDKKQIEEEINNIESNKCEEDVQIDISSKARLKSELGRGFNNKFKNLQIRYKKDKRKVLVAIAGLLAMFSALMGSSYAYLTYVSKTDNSITINAGQLALVFQNETNTINLTNAVPVKDGIGLDSDKEYSFQVKNNGSIPGAYKITLDNTCETGNEVDVCIPDEYIKVGLKVGNNSYKVVERNDKNEYILDTGSLQKGAFNTYKMKIWLDHETPNIYNATGSKNIVYRGKLGLSYEQGTRVLITLNANGGTIPAGNDWTGSGETATKELASGGTYGNLPEPTREGYTFAGWIGKNLFSGLEKGKGINHTTGVEITNDNGAVSKFITVNFEENPNYYVSGLTNTLSDYAAAYDENKQFIGRMTACASCNSRLIEKDSFTVNTTDIENNIAYIRIYQYKNNNNPETSSINDIDGIEIQLEQGTEATTYEPYQEYDSSTKVDNSTSHTLYAQWIKNS